MNTTAIIAALQNNDVVETHVQEGKETKSQGKNQKRNNFVTVKSGHSSSMTRSGDGEAPTRRSWCNWSISGGSTPDLLRPGYTVVA